jgi:four helix bundle protein
VSKTYSFPHRKLAAWHLAREARQLTYQLISDLPSGYGEDARQLRRSSGAVPKLVAEGANRWSHGAKRQRFDEAATELGETASGLEDLAGLGLIDPDGTEEALIVWGKCRATLLGLMRRLDN